MTDSPSRLVELRDITQRFGPTVALDGVSLTLHSGEVHGLIGENGAGKSTLMKVLAGLNRPTAGEVLVDGEAVRLGGPGDAMARGIAMIHQELNLVGELTVAQNILLGRERTRFGIVDAGAGRDAVEEAFQRCGWRLDPSVPVKRLSVAQQQLVEIAKALSQDARLLIMDEPTAVLTGRETQLLLGLIRDLRDRGVCVLFCSHHLSEVLAVCDRVTVLRDGKWVTTLAGSELEEGEAGERKLASLMVGRPMADYFPPRVAVEPDAPSMLRAQGVTVPGRVEGASFDVRRGEVLGLAGLVGAGRTELAEAVCGLRRMSAGSVFIDGEPVRLRGCRDAVRHGLAYLSEDRKAAGLTLGMPISANVTLASLKRHCRPWLSRASERKATEAQRERLHIRMGRPGDAIDTLSGGNQQKVALGKWLETAPRVLFVDEPTRGVDIGAKEEIYRLLRELAQAGLATVMISSEMNELLGMCHRIAVMHRGRIVTTLDVKDASEERIMEHAAGVGT